LYFVSIDGYRAGGERTPVRENRSVPTIGHGLGRGSEGGSFRSEELEPHRGTATWPADQMRKCQRALARADHKTGQMEFPMDKPSFDCLS
jgi:hypothetical protein